MGQFVFIKRYITIKRFSKVVVAGVLAASMVLFAGCSGGNNNADGDKDVNANAESQESNVLKVGTNAEFAPFEYVNEEDGTTIEGFDIDLINAIAADQGMTVEMENMEFDGLIMALENGSIDVAIAGMSVDPKRAKQVDFTETYYDAGLNIAVAIDDDSIASEEDLAGKVVTAQQGTTGANKAMELQEAGVVADVKLLANINVCMMALANGEVDAVIMDIPVNNRYVAAHPDEVKIAADIVAEEPEQYAIAVAKGNTELLEKLDAGLANVKEDGTYDALIDKYFGAAE